MTLSCYSYTTKGISNKSPKNKCVDRPGDGIAENLRLGNGNAEHTLDALLRAVEPVAPFSEAQKVDQPLSIDSYRSESRDEHECENNSFDHVFWGVERVSTHSIQQI